MERTSINPYKTFGRGNPSPVQIDTSIAYDNTNENLCFLMQYYASVQQTQMKYNR